MAPCHIPEYRPPEYEQAFDELWALACRGLVTVQQVRQEMRRLQAELAGVASATCMENSPAGQALLSVQPRHAGPRR